MSAPILISVTATTCMVRYGSTSIVEAAEPGRIAAGVARSGTTPLDVANVFEIPKTGAEGPSAVSIARVRAR
jgi:hypothetical protein